MPRPIAFAALVAALHGGAIASPIVVEMNQPTLDRWNYPFNPTPGQRITASTFGVFGDERFDNRDAQFLVGFDTGAFVPTGEGANRYVVTEAVVRVRVAEGNAFRYDPTYDSYRTYLPTDHPDYLPDSDNGRPMELYGAAFRNGFTSATFTETAPHGPAFGIGVRNAFPTDFVGGVPDDVSNNIRFAFETTPFAIGRNNALTPGQLVPINTQFTFDIDVTNPDALAFVQQGLNEGRLRFIISSLHPAEDPGIGDERGITINFPVFFTKENKFGGDPFFFAPQLRLVVSIAEPGVPGDANGDGVVNFDDLAIVLGQFGQAGTGLQGDLNDDGVVDFDDLALVLGNFGVGGS